MTQTYVKDYTNSYIVRGKEYEVIAPARFDKQTNEIVPDSELDDAAAEMANAMYRKEFDVVTPEQIKTFRKSNGLSQRDLSKMLGWSKTTVALYEAGAIPNEANNILLQQVLTNRSFYHALLSKANITPKTPKLETMDVLKLTHWFMVQSYFEVKKDESGFVEPLGLLKVQKLLYQLKGYALANFSVPLYSDNSLAWEYGPVVDKIFREYKSQRDLTKNEFINKQAFDDYSELMSIPEVSSLLEEVWNRYGSKRASELVTITHVPGSPWSLTPRDEVIDNKTTKLYFGQIINKQ